MSKSTPACHADRPEDRLAKVMQTFFRSVSGSQDRELANTAFRLEPQVLKLIRSSGRKLSRPTA